MDGSMSNGRGETSRVCINEKISLIRKFWNGMKMENPLNCFFWQCNCWLLSLWKNFGIIVHSFSQKLVDRFFWSDACVTINQYFLWKHANSFKYNKGAMNQLHPCVLPHGMSVAIAYICMFLYFKGRFC